MAEKILIEIDVDAKDAEKDVEGLGKAAETTGKKAKDSKKGFDAMAKGVQAVASAAIIVTLIVKAFGALKAAFTSSEEGQNRYAKAMAVIESVFNNLLDVVADFTELVVDAFENPQEAIKNFGQLIKDNMINRFEGLMELLPQLGKAIDLLFEGEFAEAGKVAANAVAKVTLGVDDIVGKTLEAIETTKDFIKEIEREGAIAASIADKRAKADLKERELIVARAEANRRIAEIREQSADKDNISAEERIELLEEAGRVAEEITRKEIEAAKLRLEAIQAENTLANSNKEAKNAEAEAEAKLIELETARLQQQAALTAELTGTRREAAAEAIAIENEKAAELKTIADQAAKEESDRVKQAEKEKKDSIDATTKANKAAANIKKIQDEGTIKTGVAVFSAIESLAKEGSKTAKAAAIGQTTIDTYQSAVAAYKGLVGIPVVGQVLAPIAAGAAIAMGLKSVQQISATDNGSGGGGGGGSISANIPTAVSAPEFQISGDNDTTNFVAVNNQPVKAYISFDDLADADQQNTDTENGSSI